MRRGQWVGAQLALSTGYARTIVDHAEGYWSATERPRAVVHVAGIDGAEPASVASGAAIIPSDSLILVRLSGASYSGYRIVIPASSTQGAPAEDYWRIGSIAVGWVLPVSIPWSWGGSQSLSARVEVAETRSGIDAVRVLAPAAREWTLSQTAGIPTSGLYEAEGMAASAWGGDVEQSEAGLGWALLALVSSTDGPARPLVMVREAAAGTGAVWAVTDRMRLLFGRMQDAITLDSAQGDLDRSELQRVQAIIVREVV
jgi:hypothetical protein